MLENPDLDRYVGEQVTDRGKPVGTVVDVDRDAAEFALEPSGELPKNAWEALGWSAADDYDADWEDVDYDQWQAGESDVPVDYDEWPYTLPANRLEDGDDGLELVDA